MAECPPLGPVQKQVQFNLADDLGDAPSVPMDLANFLGENATDEQIDAPHPSASLTADPPQLPCDNGYQCSTNMGGAQLKTSTAKPMAAIQAKPQPRRTSDLVDHADDWIWLHMSREAWHPHWWKEFKAVYRDCLAGNLSDVHALQLVQWQATAFRLPLEKEEASGW